ncbi:metallophosphoesterase, partial [Paraglaciecola sp.]|uniref:metallophosphoesterase family protein n=1 Tax=Paraglaciecola sp. TaxID=1920173 RepID=UPI0030F466A2
MKYSKLLIAPCILMSWLASAQPNFIVQPYLQNPKTDGMSISLEINEQDVQLHYRKKGTEQAFTTLSMNTVTSTTNIYRAQIQGLNSNTRYEYYVSTEKGDSEVWGFKTWPTVNDDQETIKIIVFSDSQGQHASRLADMVKNGMIPNNCNNDVTTCDDEIAAILVPGDLVQTGSDVNQWRNDFFGTAAQIFARVPIIPAIGNHDYSLTHFQNYFDLPDNNSDYPEQWYSFDYLNLRIITLNSNTSTNSTLEKQQRVWLDTLLADTETNTQLDYVMMQIHHPCKSELWLPGEKDLTCQYVKKFENISAQTGKITGHLFGHTHAYSRGQSRDVSHLWLNAAVSSGDIDYWDEYQMYDYDEFQKSYPEFGYSLLEFGVKQQSMHVKRYSGGDGINQYWGYQGEGIRDDFVVGGENVNPEQPTAIAPNGSVVDGAFSLVASEFADADNDSHLESHWQVSSDPTFNTVALDFWGNKTRSENIWRYENTQAGVALNTYDVDNTLPTG